MATNTRNPLQTLSKDNRSGKWIKYSEHGVIENSYSILSAGKVSLKHTIAGNQLPTYVLTNSSRSSIKTTLPLSVALPSLHPSSFVLCPLLPPSLTASRSLLLRTL